MLYSIYFVAVTLLFQLLAMFSCFTMYMRLTRVNNSLYIASLASQFLNKPLVSNVKYNMAKTNHIELFNDLPCSRSKLSLEPNLLTSPFLRLYFVTGGGSCTKAGGYINFQGPFAWRNLQSYAGLVKSGGLQPPYSAAYA